VSKSFNYVYENWRKNISKTILFNALKTALLVGSFITLINQYDAFTSQKPFYPVRALISYCVPFFVFIYSRLSSNNCQ